MLLIESIDPIPAFFRLMRAWCSRPLFSVFIRGEVDYIPQIKRKIISTKSDVLNSMVKR